MCIKSKLAYKYVILLYVIRSDFENGHPWKKTYEEGMVVQVVGENKFVHQKKSIMMAKTVNTQSKTTLKHAGIIPSIWYSSRLSFQINQNKFIVKECLFVL